MFEIDLFACSSLTKRQLHTVNLARVQQSLNATLSDLPLKWMWRISISTGVGFSEKAVWSRAARRQAAKGEETEVDREAEMALGFKIHVGKTLEETGVQVTIRWLKGHDSVLFESFCGMVKRKLEESMK